MAEICWYNIWSSVVRAEGTFRYDAMLMSKKFMCSLWSWDHCFNALAAARGNLQLGLDQFFLPFEQQAPSGALPDFMKPNTETVWGVTKPPIHGWCFQRLMQRYNLDASTLEKAYSYLQKWTEWWMVFRDSDADGIPEYPQGCDSGWDNATLFDIGYFLEAPDLSAYLVLQMKCLAEISGKIGNVKNEQYWQQRAENLLHQLYTHSWNGERFIARLSGSHEFAENPTSLLALMPIVLGEYLDQEKFDRLVDILQRDFLTANGPATEAPESTDYEADSYWRGPIWAPSTYLIVDGLQRGGRKELAREIARRFCDMIRDKAGGNYENFDAISGKGLRAPGYTWTSSVNLLLMWEYLM
jgi:glycogen debranching enzyme